MLPHYTAQGWRLCPGGDIDPTSEVLLSPGKGEDVSQSLGFV